ncbi:MAG: hypothetical protein HFI26_07450 [Lachnospiraceae bacterium]|jgi:hypothetical protein|nr:hypothetical protein [Lachnospiraceae bacterium]
MDAVTQVGAWLIEVFRTLWQAFGTWGVIGFFLIAMPILYKLGRLARKLINF